VTWGEPYTYCYIVSLYGRPTYWSGKANKKSIKLSFTTANATLFRFKTRLNHGDSNPIVFEENNKDYCVNYSGFIEACSGTDQQYFYWKFFPVYKKRPEDHSYDYKIREAFGNRGLYASKGDLVYGSNDEAAAVMISDITDENGEPGKIFWFQKELCLVQASSMEWLNKDSPTFQQVKCSIWNPLEVALPSIHSWKRILCPACATIVLKGWQNVGWTLQVNSTNIWISFLPGVGGKGSPYAGWQLEHRNSKTI